MDSQQTDAQPLISEDSAISSVAEIKETVMETESSESKVPELKEEQDSLSLAKSSALSMLQQYTYSDESEGDEGENGDQKQPKYRIAEVSSDSSSSSSDSSDDEQIDLSRMKKKLDQMLSEEDDEDGEEAAGQGRKKKEPLRVRGELLLEDLPPIQDLNIQVDERECLEIGTITSIVDQLLLVEAYPHSAPLDIDTVLFLDKGKKALGQVFDVIGQVSTPIYCIRFNSHDDIASKGIAIGQKVFCAPRTEHTHFVILQNIMGKGSDASWRNDLEVPDNMVEYSDDEEERTVKRQGRPKLGAKRQLPNQEDFSWHTQKRWPNPLANLPQVNNNL